MSEILSGSKGFPNLEKIVKVNPTGPQTSVLSPELRELQRLLFSSVETLPAEFRNWVGEYPAVYGQQIPGSNVSGSTLIRQEQVLSGDNTSSTTYTSLGTVGPQVTGLSNGTYLLIFGCVFTSASGNAGWMSPSVNGATPSDNDAAFEDPTSGNRYNITRAVVKNLDNNNNNTITMQYRVSANTNQFSYRWLVVMRTGR